MRILTRSLSRLIPLMDDLSKLIQFFVSNRKDGELKKRIGKDLGSVGTVSKSDFKT